MKRFQQRFQLREKESIKSRIIAAVAGVFILLTIGAPLFISPLEVLPVEIPGVMASGINPQTCIGYDQLKQRWGADAGLCPANHAFFGVDDPAGAKGPAKRISVSMSCCPLPAKDILSTEHIYSTDDCPKDYVATGSRRRGSKENKVVHMRCTKINTSRYQLGEATEGIYWGEGAAGWSSSKRIAWENIPASMRFAHGRKSADKWDVDGCVGYPWGSLLTKKKSKNCSSFSFQQLQYKGTNANDPLAGKAVQMIPNCSEMENVGSPDARCKS